jgi:hypothetical protein
MAAQPELGWFSQRWQAWREDAAPDLTQGALLFDRIALRIYCWSLILLPSWLLIDAAKRFRVDAKSSEEYWRIHREKENAAARYLAFWYVVLAASWIASPDSEILAKIFACIALFRLVEIGNTILGFILSRREPLLAGSLVTVALQALQIAFIFAIVDHAFARHAFVMQEGESVGQTATTALDYLYLSLTTMITLGNKYSPETGVARLLEVGTAMTGIVLLGVVVARAIGLSGGSTAP